MNRYLSVLVLLLIPFILSAENTIDTIKSKQKNDVVSVKMRLNSPMIEEDFISNITASVGGTNVFDFLASPFVRRKPTIKFKFKNLTKKDTYDVVLTHNTGKQEQQNFTIHKSRKMSKIHTSKIETKLDNNAVWKASTVDSAIKELYGVSNIKTKIIKEQICRFYSSIPIHIKSDTYYKSISIFQDANPRSAVAIFNIPKNQIIDYEIFIEMKKDGIITTVFENKDGELFKELQPVVVSGTISHLSCHGNQLINDM